MARRWHCGAWPTTDAVAQQPGWDAAKELLLSDEPTCFLRVSLLDGQRLRFAIDETAAFSEGDNFASDETW